MCRATRRQEDVRVPLVPLEVGVPNETLGGDPVDPPRVEFVWASFGAILIGYQEALSSDTDSDEDEEEKEDYWESEPINEDNLPGSRYWRDEWKIGGHMWVLVAISSAVVSDIEDFETRKSQCPKVADMLSALRQSPKPNLAPDRIADAVRLWCEWPFPELRIGAFDAHDKRWRNLDDEFDDQFPERQIFRDIEFESSRGVLGTDRIPYYYQADVWPIGTEKKKTLPGMIGTFVRVTHAFGAFTRAVLFFPDEGEAHFPDTAKHSNDVKLGGTEFLRTLTAVNNGWGKFRADWIGANKPHRWVWSKHVVGSMASSVARRIARDRIAQAISDPRFNVGDDSIRENFLKFEKYRVNVNIPDNLHFVWTGGADGDFLNDEDEIPGLAEAQRRCVDQQHSISSHDRDDEGVESKDGSGSEESQNGTVVPIDTAGTARRTADYNRGGGNGADVDTTAAGARESIALYALLDTEAF